jgi:putative endonuclease
MAAHNDSGRVAEQEAALWLESKGYTLLEANYRHQHAEIDLIMTHQGLLVFIEVKFRTGTGFGYAEEFVDGTKKRLLVKAADQYIYQKDWHRDIRFDIVGVYKDSRGTLHFRQFEDAFY